MSESILLCANEPLFDYILAQYFNAKRQDFNFVAIEQDINTLYEFAATSAPTMDLSPRTDNSNFAISFSSVEIKMYDYENGKQGQLIDESVTQLTITGVLGLSGQSITMTSLNAIATGGQDNHLVVREVDRRLLPQYRSEVQNMPLPDLTKVLGFAVVLSSVRVANNQVWVLAGLPGAGQAALPDSSMPSTNQPAIFAAISTTAVHDLVHELFSPVSKQVGDSSSSAGFGYRGSASASASNPQVWISGGKASGTIDVSASASGGIEVVGDWTDVPISVSVSTPPLGLKLVTDGAGKTAYVEPYITDPVSLSFDLPGVLGDVADDILGAINSLAGTITSAINDGLAAINIKALALPATVPGTDYQVNLAFEGLSFSGNSVVSTITAS